MWRNRSRSATATGADAGAASPTGRVLLTACGRLIPMSATTSCRADITITPWFGPTPGATGPGRNRLATGCGERLPARSKFARHSARHDLTRLDHDLQMRMDAADRADAPLDRPSHEVWI